MTRANGDRTRALILDAAEILFGAKGFDAVSLREITDKADVTLALASYHFGTKDALFEEVVARRAAILSREREDRLKALGPADIRTILDAFMDPLFAKAKSGEPGWTDYFRVVARLGESDRWLHLLKRHFDPTAQKYVAALSQAMPHARPAEVARGFTMVLHVMLNTVSQHPRIDQLTDGKVAATDLAEAYDTLLTFVVTGMASFEGAE